MRRTTPGATISRVAIVMFFAGTLLSCQGASNDASDSGQESRQKQSMSGSGIQAAGNEDSKDASKLIVYYFHGTYRCASCNLIEELTQEAVASGFAEELKGGRIEMRILNVEEEGNKHFVKDYALYTKAVVLSDLRNGNQERWKNLEKVWTLLRNEDKFIQYIQKEVKSFL